MFVGLKRKKFLIHTEFDRKKFGIAIIVGKEAAPLMTGPPGE
jgi:hypothetical protein